jgi:hypothetical protein
MKRVRAIKEVDEITKLFEAFTLALKAKMAAD